MYTENRITINGPAAKVYELAEDVMRWPEILPHYRWVKLIRQEGDFRVVEMAARRDFIPVKWTSIQEPRPEQRCIIFRHLGGPTKGMYVEWDIWQEDTVSGPVTQVKIWHEFSPDWPVIGPFASKYIVGDFFVHYIAGKTLACIKRAVEGGTV
jgi:ribosome-associated toxin RatA of RatAB toxin-antitoxin module